MKKLILLFTLMGMVLTSAAQSEVRDENGVITTPAAGISKVYKREGKVVVPVGFGTSEGLQSGSVTVVFCEDGSVYMQHPLSETLEHTRMDPNIWIKGTQQGDLIRFPSQAIGYSTAFRTAAIIAMGDMSIDGGRPVAKPDRSEDIIFKVIREGKILELQGSSSTHVVGAFYDSDSDSYDYWDFATTLVLDNSDEHAPAVVPPAGLSTTSYILHGYDAVAAGDGMGMGVSFCAQLGFDGNDAYLGDFSYYSYTKKLWLKGRKEGDKVIFPKEQYLYTDEDQYDYYFYALPNGSTAAQAEDLVLTYDPATGNYTSGQDIFICKEKMTSTLERTERVEGVVMIAFKNPEDEAIHSAPAGYTQISYERHGQCIADNTGWFDCEDINFSLEVAWSPDRKEAYMKNPLTLYNNMEVWVKATVGADGKLHLPLLQYVQKDDYYSDFRIGVCRILWINKAQQRYTYVFDPTIEEITYSIGEDGTLSMTPLYEGEISGQVPAEYIYGAIGSASELLWAGVGEAYSVLTPIEGSEVIVDEGEGTTGKEEEKIDITTPVPGEQKNEYGIITSPGTGAASTYTRSGENYHAEGSIPVSGQQSGLAHIVECEGGVVYLQCPVSAYSKGYAATAWIRGVKRESGIYFPQGQPIGYHEYYEEAVGVYMGTYSEEDGIMADRNKVIAFAVDEENNALTLVGSNNVTPMGVFYCEGGEWTGYGDYRTVLTYKSSGIEEMTVAPSDKATQRHYTLTATDLEEGTKGYNAVVAFEPESDEVYMSGFSFWTHYSQEMHDQPIWIKGRQRADGALVFAKEQYLFRYNDGQGAYDLFFYGAEAPFAGAFTLADVVFTLDPATGCYSTEQDLLTTWGKVSTSINRAEQLTGAVLRPDDSEGTRPYIIKEQPEGTLYSYSRSGVAFGYDDFGKVVMTEQSGDVSIVISHDGKFAYMHNPVSLANPAGGGSWVSGKVDADGRLHFPTMQWIDWNEEVGYGARTAAMVRMDGDNGTYRYMMIPNLAEFTFTLDPTTGTYSLDRIPGIDYDDAEAPRLIYGVVWSHTYEWAGYGDFDSRYTPNFEWHIEGIDSPAILPQKSADLYDLQGRAIGNKQASRGLMIQGGRKVLR